MWDQFRVDMTILAGLLVAGAIVVILSPRTRAVISLLFTGRGATTGAGPSRPESTPGGSRQEPGDRA
jgi:hypothetical protein